MKRMLIVVVAVALMGFMTSNAGATPIYGAISFAGNDTLDNPNLNLATKFLTFTDTVVSSVGGDYSPIPPGTAATFTPFQFRTPPAASVIPLWTLGFGGKTYSFDATSVVVEFSNVSTLVIQGLGLAHITGYEDTIGSWAVTANNAQTTYSFSASSSAPLVPEPATMLLLGTGLVGLAYGVRRRFKK